MWVTLLKRKISHAHFDSEHRGRPDLSNSREIDKIDFSLLHFRKQ